MGLAQIAQQLLHREVHSPKKVKKTPEQLQEEERIAHENRVAQYAAYDPHNFRGRCARLSEACAKRSDTSSSVT